MGKTEAELFHEELLRKKTGGFFHDVRVCKNILNTTHKKLIIRNTLNENTFKLRNVRCNFKNTIKRMKRQSSMEEYLPFTYVINYFYVKSS